MKPVKLFPAYRHGRDTPWGGDALRRVFGKNIPDDRTGESLEASTLPNLESRDARGVPLSEIAGGRLPLLLKLLDARERLSVQVHPGDAYAQAHEHKRGKAEAWVILEAAPNAEIIYGLLPGTDLRALPDRRAVEGCLRRVPVRAGDVFDIPPGMVHAIGSGILLYEIQQASDLTYRLWDWGSDRALHWEKALDVADASLRLDAICGTRAGDVTHLLRTEHFALCRLHVRGGMETPAFGGFAFLTALGAGQADGTPLRAGDTVFLTETARLAGDFDALMSFVG